MFAVLLSVYIIILPGQMFSFLHEYISIKIFKRKASVFLLVFPPKIAHTIHNNLLDCNRKAMFIAARENNNFSTKIPYSVWNCECRNSARCFRFASTTHIIIPSYIIIGCFNSLSLFSARILVSAISRINRGKLYSNYSNWRMKSEAQFVCGSWTSCFANVFD